MGSCCTYFKYVLIVLIALIALLSTRTGRGVYRVAVAWPFFAFGFESPMIQPITKIVTLPYFLACLVASGEDFRREIFLQSEDLANGQAFYTWNGNGVLGMSYEVVSKDMMNPKQQRGPYFGLNRIGKTQQGDSEGAVIPNECMPKNLLLFKSSDDPEHAKFRDILHREVGGLTRLRQGAYDLNLVLPGDFPTESLDDVEDINAHLLKVVGMNILARMFYLDDSIEGSLSTLETWNERLAEIIVEYQSTVPLCAVGIPGTAGKAPQIGKLMDELNDILGKTPVGERVVKAADKELRDGGRDMLAQLVFGSLFAGLGGTFHLTSHTVRRIRSDPDRYLPLYTADPDAFLLEQARIDPPVTSYSSILTYPVNIDVWPYGTLHVSEGTPAQMTLATANREVSVFGGKDRSRAYADTFDPTRPNLDRILSWNGIFKDVGLGKSAPRGCPGVDLSRDIAREVVDLLVPMIKRDRRAAMKGTEGSQEL